MVPCLLFSNTSEDNLQLIIYLFPVIIAMFELVDPVTGDSSPRLNATGPFVEFGMTKTAPRASFLTKSLAVALDVVPLFSARSTISSCCSWVFGV